VADRIWHSGYWVSKAKAKKSATWVKVVLALAVLWVFGHTSGIPIHDDAKTHPAPSASASAHPGKTSHPKHSTHAKH
jgi:hypothetical protein